MHTRTLGIAVASVAALLAGSAGAATFSGFGNDTNGPEFVITVTDTTTTVALQTPDQGPYDGSEDTYIGVVNNSSKAVTSLNLSSANDIFGFDGDGIDTFGATGNTTDTTGYGGPLGVFSNIASSGGVETGTISFLGGVAPGSSTFFSLEDTLTSANSITVTNGGGVPEPATWAMMLAGFFGLGAVLRTRRREQALA